MLPISARLALGDPRRTVLLTYSVEKEVLAVELSISDDELDRVIAALPVDDPLRARLSLIKKVRLENPGGPWKAILREQHQMMI